MDVLRLAADGLSNAQIAGRLYLTLATVKSHLAHTYAKLRRTSRQRQSPPRESAACSPELTRSPIQRTP
ncbi:MAG: helix-turn-helix transcriptional regulator [Micropruina glycogenica]